MKFSSSVFATKNNGRGFFFCFLAGPRETAALFRGPN